MHVCTSKKKSTQQFITYGLTPQAHTPKRIGPKWSLFGPPARRTVELEVRVCLTFLPHAVFKDQVLGAELDPQDDPDALTTGLQANEVGRA